MNLRQSIGQLFSGLAEVPGEETSPIRYTIMRRNMTILMLLITLVPLSLMTVINYYEYRSVLKDEIVTPQKVLVNKAKHSIELFLANRLATVNFIASAYSYDELADEANLNRIFRVLKREFEGFVDLGLIDSDGIQVSYAGPYKLQGKDYSEQSWFEQVRVNGTYVSDVFKGYRRFPHIALAVQTMPSTGKSWIVRATINTGKLDELIASMGLDAESDAFLVNKEGVLQTNSKYYGQALDQCPCIPSVSYEPTVLERVDPSGREIILTYAYFPTTDFILMLIKPQAQVMRAWYSLKGDLLLVFLLSVGLIVAVVLRLTKTMFQRMKEADDKRALALREMEHNHKLSSIGRLAAGVAHEINNPLAVINEKAGLMKDLIEFTPNFPEKERFMAPVGAIIGSVERCRTITHRLLGFARRMDVEIQVLDVNDVIRETLGFLEKEALYRNIKVNLNLGKELPKIESDRGQLQQVFLNILNNALQAMDDGGTVSLATFERDENFIGVTIQDTGHGMSEETLKHVFEPFFTTKAAGKGTGLGLSITYGLVKKLGGDVDVQSKIGKGTRFTVYLPKKHNMTQGNNNG
ncbi:MAG: ATP-binding protein [Desulfomonilaceae bacterium]